MAPRSDRNGSAKKNRNAITIFTKMDILKRFENGERAIDISRVLGIPPTTIRTIKKNEQKTRDSVAAGVSNSSSFITKTRSIILEKMEKLLTVFLTSDESS